MLRKNLVAEWLAKLFLPLYFILRQNNKISRQNKHILKDIVSYSPFFMVEYMFLKQFVKLMLVKFAYFTYLLYYISPASFHEQLPDY